jgi:hypothetical protein
MDPSEVFEQSYAILLKYPLRAKQVLTLLVGWLCLRAGKRLKPNVLDILYREAHEHDGTVVDFYMENLAIHTNI